MNTILGLGVSNWVLYIMMILFIVVYFVVTERINRKEDEVRNQGEDE